MSRFLHAGQTAPQIETFERQAQALIGAFPRRPCLLAAARRNSNVSSSACRPRSARWPRMPANPDRLSSARSRDSSRCVPRRHRRRHAPDQPIDAGDEFVLSRHDHLGGRRRRRGAQIRDEIRDGDIGLVADRGDHRHGRSGDGASHDFLIEGPQILDRTAAASRRGSRRRP